MKLELIIKILISVLFFLCLLVVLISCNSREIKREEQRKITKERYDNDLNKIKDSILNLYDINYDWDSLNFHYSIQYQEIISNDFQLLINPIIHDIYYADSLIFMTLFKRYNTYHIWDYPKFHFQLEVPKNILGQMDMSINDRSYLIRNESIEGNWSKSGQKLINDKYYPTFFVIRIDFIKKYSFNEEPIVEPPDYFQSEIELSNTFFCKGKLIDIIRVNLVKTQSK